MSTSEGSPRRSPRLRAQKPALSPVNLNDVSLVLPPQTPTRKSPRKQRKRSPSPESPIRRSPRLVAKEKLADCKPLSLDNEPLLNPQADAFTEETSPEPPSDGMQDQDLGDATMQMSPQANPPAIAQDTPEPFTRVDTDLILRDVSVSVPAFASPEPLSPVALAVPGTASPLKRVFEQVSTPEMTAVSPPPPETSRPIASPIRHRPAATSPFLSHEPAASTSPVRSSMARTLLAENDGLTAQTTLSSTRTPSFALPTRASMARASIAPSPSRQESPAKMMRLSHIPDLEPQLSPSRKSTSPGQLPPPSISESHSPMNLRTPLRAMRQVPSSPMRRSLSPVRSAVKLRRRTPLADIEALLGRVGAELQPAELRSFDMRIESSGTRYAREIRALYQKVEQLESELKKLPAEVKLAPGLEPFLSAYKSKVDGEVTGEILHNEIRAAKEFLDSKTLELSEFRNQNMQQGTLAARERNLKARIAEYEKLIKERPATASKLGDVIAEVEKKSVALKAIYDRVKTQTQGLQEASNKSEASLQNLVGQQTASTKLEAEAKARLGQAKSQVMDVLHAFKMNGISWSPNGFVLRHRFLDIVYNKKAKSQKFILKGNNPVFEHYFALLDSAKPIRTNLETWTSALDAYGIISGLRSLGFSRWVKRGTQLVLLQRIPQGTIEVVLDRGMPSIVAKVQDQSLKESLTDFQSLSALYTTPTP